MKVENNIQLFDFNTYRKYRKIANELDKLPPELLQSIEAMIHTAAEIASK